MSDFLADLPAGEHLRVREIAALTDAFCAAHLNEEYRDICRELLLAAAGAGVPLGRGKAVGWAAGVVATVAFANFLGDPTQSFHLTNEDIAHRIGSSPATLQSKAGVIKETLRVQRLDPQFCTQAQNEKNPLIWLVSVNGIAVDLRTAPRGLQEAAFRQGQVPYIPADGPGGRVIRHWMPDEIKDQLGPKKKTGKKKAGTKTGAGPARVYTLLVRLVGGPIDAAFVKNNPQVSRTIEIRGDQTLDDLHQAVFDAFDRDDPHLYEFQFGKKPMDRTAVRYVAAGDEDDGPGVGGTTAETTLDSLELKVKSRFWYWFDFGDDWMHRIDVKDIAEAAATGTFPRVVKTVGKSPPQYPEWG